MLPCYDGISQDYETGYHCRLQAINPRCDLSASFRQSMAFRTHPALWNMIAQEKSVFP